MKSRIKKIIYDISLFFVVLVLATPSLVYGQTESVTAGPRLLNPLKVNSIQDLLTLILQIVTLFATPVIVFFIIYAGFLFVTARGNDAQLTKAKNALLWSLIGGAIILGANILLIVITNTVHSLQP